MDFRYQSFGVFKKIFVIPRSYILHTVDFPFELFRNIVKYVVSHTKLVQENIYLKQLNQIESAKLQILHTLELENIRLKNLLNFSEQQKQVFGLAKVIDVVPDPFKHQVVLNKGLQHGVYVGQPIVDAHGVLGSIISVEEKISTAILITDFSYAVPVVNLRNEVRAIALGTGKFTELTLQHVPHTADIKEQDVFVTSGIGGKYPSGYKVGVVDRVQHEKNFPFASISLKVEERFNSCHEVLLIYGDRK